MPPMEKNSKQNRESAYDVPGPYWCMHEVPIARACKGRNYRLPPRNDCYAYITRVNYNYAYARHARKSFENNEKKSKKRRRKEEKEEKRK